MSRPHEELTPTFQPRLNARPLREISGCRACAAGWFAASLPASIPLLTFEVAQIVPSVHVTYAQEVYTHPSLVAHHPALIPTTPTTPPELIAWDLIEPPESVVCYEWARGFHLDLPYRRTREKPFRR